MDVGISIRISFKMLLHEYQNGNYTVKIYDDGTKIRETEKDEFIPCFPESIDLKITDYCDNNCPMCHEKSNVYGKHASLDVPFLKTLHKGTELAIGGGNPLSHPDLISFLTQMQKQGVICNMTVNENHLLKNITFIQELINKKLIYGLGISLITYDPQTIMFAKKNLNSVLHLILGIVTRNQLRLLYGKNLKILFLGYKRFGRGEEYYSDIIEENIQMVKDSLYYFKGFSLVSFDNLALEQLSIKKKISKDIWDERFMGNDGEFTMYIDLVKSEYAISSISNNRYKIKDNIEEMFISLKEGV